MQLVDEEDDPAFGLADLLQHGLEPLLKFAAVLRAGDKRAHVEREDGLVLESLRHVPAHDALGEPLGDGRLADARLADQHGVVLGLAREDADDVADLVVAPDHGVKLVVAGALHEVGAVFGERVVGALWVVPGDGGGLHLAERRREGGFRDAVLGEDALDRRGGRGENADHQVLNGGVLVAHGFGGAFGGVEGSVGLG